MISEAPPMRSSTGRSLWSTRGLGRFEGPAWRRDPWDAVVPLIAKTSIVIVGLDLFVAKAVTLALVVAVGTLPLWIREIRRYSLAGWLLALAPLSLVWGYLLAMSSAAEHQIDPNNAVAFAGIVLSGAAAFALVLWTRAYTSIHQIALLYGVGGLMSAAMLGNFNWKFHLAVPMTFIVLGLAGASQRRVLSAGVILLLGAFGVLNESRSYFAFCLIAAILTLWQALPARPPEERRLRRWVPAVVMAVVGALVYVGASALMTSGALGTEVQERSVAQISTSGSLISGGRPEWAATRALIEMTPQGYGIGVVPSWTDLQTGRAGLASINVDAGGYTNNFMFGGAFELHSVVSDLWVSCGIVGAALAVLVLFCLIRNVSYLLAARRASTIVLFTTGIALWAVLFGPLYTDWRVVCVSLGLSMLPTDQLPSRRRGALPPT